MALFRALSPAWMKSNKIPDISFWPGGRDSCEGGFLSHAQPFGRRRRLNSVYLQVCRGDVAFCPLQSPSIL